MLKIQFLFIAWFPRRFSGQKNNHLSYVYTYDSTSMVIQMVAYHYHCHGARGMAVRGDGGLLARGSGVDCRHRDGSARAPYRTLSQLSNTSIDALCQTLFAESLTFFTGRGIEAWLAVPP